MMVAAATAAWLLLMREPDGGAPALKPADLCALVSSIVTAEAVRPRQVITTGETPERVSFAERKDVDRLAGVGGRILTRLLWDKGLKPRRVVRGGFAMDSWSKTRRPQPMFREGDVCRSDDFLLEHEQKAEEVGSSAYIVEILLRRKRGEKGDSFEFEEGLAPYGPRRKGGSSVPPLMGSGTVERTPDADANAKTNAEANAKGRWRARITKTRLW